MKAEDRQRDAAKARQAKKKALRILAVAAHPDDVELACAGTLGRCIDRGDTVTEAIVCQGEMASTDLPPAERVRVRSKEARRSAALLGAELFEMGLSDGCVESTETTKHLFTDVIRRADPDVIITHYHDDYGSDHNNTFTLVLDAALYATVPNIRTEHPPIKRSPLLYMMEPLGGYRFQPQVYVDITETFELKSKMLACHRSQLEWMRRHGEMNLSKYIEVLARFRGYQAGVEFAEGFIPHASLAHVAAGPVLP